MKIALNFSIALMIATLIACNESGKDKGQTTTSEQKTTTDDHAAASPNPVPMLPSFAVQDINGKMINLQSLKGKKLFVNLWATWCGPCKREMPSIAKLVQSTDTNKVAFVMISLDDHFDKARKYIKNQKLSLPIYYPGENLPELFDVNAIPSTFIFNEKGELIKRIEGSEDYDSDVYRGLFK